MGAVNIFLGGTGKHIAEDIQDSKDFFGLTISEPIAFDLDVDTRAGVDLRGFVHPGPTLTKDVDDVANEWMQLDPGPKLAPKANGVTPGPEISPEHSVLVDIGRGIAASPAPKAGLFALRGHGLSVFSALFDEGRAFAGTGEGLRLRKLIDNAIKSQASDGVPPRINLITSTAGGTGAGTVIPLALWLKENYPNSPRTLVAVTPDAFDEVLKGEPGLADLKTKGLSGTYAMFRELSFFQEVDPLAGFLPGRLPVVTGTGLTSDGLEYAPGAGLFDYIHWFGGRDALQPRDAFEEAGALVRILNDNAAAGAIDGKVGANPLQSVGAITAIEYPKLRLQRKLVSQVLSKAYERLRSPARLYGGAAPKTVSLLEYVSPGCGRKLGEWFDAIRNGAFAPKSQESPLRERDLRDLSDGIYAEATKRNDAIDLYDGVRRGPDYDAPFEDWKLYVARVTADVDKRAQGNQERLTGSIGEMRAGEEEAFADWLRESVFGENGWLSGDPLAPGGARPYGTADAKNLLNDLNEGARDLDERVADTQFIPEPTLADLDGKISRLTSKFEKPDTVSTGPSGQQRIIGLAVAAVIALIWLFPLQALWNSIPRFGEFGNTAVSEILVVVGALFIAIAVYQLVTWWIFYRSRKGLPDLRREAEDRLFAAYRERDRTRAVRWLHEELRATAGKQAFFRELRYQIESVSATVDKLDKLYEELHDDAEAEAKRVASDPVHVRATVGDCILLDVKVADRITPEIARRLRIDTTIDPDFRVRSPEICLQRFDNDEDQVTPAREDIAYILAALDPDAPAGGVGRDLEVEAANRWRDALWDLVNRELAQNLPETFVDALRHCAGGDDGAATGALVSRLNALTLPRPPSTNLQVPAINPGFRQIYAGNAAILASFQAALAHPALAPAVKADLSLFGKGNVVGSLGQQLVFMDLWTDSQGQHWAPNVISNATVAQEALATYYKTDADTCFTVLPELRAATKIELGAGVIEPLAPVVAARLLGSDLDLQGPTYAELFYLLRARGSLGFSAKGVGPGAKTVVQLNLDDSLIDLVELPPGAVPDMRFFGSGRGSVIAFDVFCDFMRFDGTPLIAGRGAPAPFPGTVRLTADWAADPRRVARLQRAAVMQWYEGNIEADCEDMVRVLDDDVEQMDAVGDEAYKARESWNRAMRRLIDGEERRRIRSTLMTGM